MSDTIINWRFWHWHFQVRRWCDWIPLIRSGRSPIAIFANEWHRGLGSVRYPSVLRGRQDPEWKRVQFYEGKCYLIGLIAAVALTAWGIA